MNTKAFATAVNDFYPDTCKEDTNGRLWLTARYTSDQCPYIDFPKSVFYEGTKYYYMSYNSDGMYVSYAAAGTLAWHERY